MNRPFVDTVNLCRKHISELFATLGGLSICKITPAKERFLECIPIVFVPLGEATDARSSRLHINARQFEPPDHFPCDCDDINAAPRQVQSDVTTVTDDRLLALLLAPTCCRLHDQQTDTFSERIESCAQSRATNIDPQRPHSISS